MQRLEQPGSTSLVSGNHDGPVITKLRHSFAFCLGIPFVVFVSWLWVDTHHRWVTLAFDYPNGTFYLASWHGELWLQQYQFKGGATNTHPSGVIVDRIPDDLDDGNIPAWFPSEPFRNLQEEDDERNAWGVAVAHWLVLTVYLAVWLGLLIWRRTLKSRTTTSA